MKLRNRLLIAFMVLLVATGCNAAFLTSSKNPASVGETFTIQLTNEVGGTFGATIVTEGGQSLGSVTPVGPGAPAGIARISLSFPVAGAYVIHAEGYLDCPVTSTPATCGQSRTAPFTQVIVPVSSIPASTPASLAILSFLLCLIAVAQFSNKLLR
jgi:hypothetical protein